MQGGLLDYYREKDSRVAYYDPDGCPDGDEDLYEWPFDGDDDDDEFDVDDFEFENDE